ncbi:hypothetical protein M3936_20280 [Sutcliffiella horikoshii]|uniref:hypothetical protein n=1 Tax=Sutcliffiella horikoshii TaxID=79883 RepID=UPI00203D88E0|nr:hypothetical protein [Sutcliffiella horikoshii]MCM3619914.1 hypothetical protein [Sutcliffiella horikoshii]
MKKGLIFFGLLLFMGFGTNFLIRFLRDGDFYYAEFLMSMIGVILISVGMFLKKSDNASNNPY